MSREVATKLVDFVLNTSYEDIPSDVATFTKALTLKTVAGMIAGSATPPGQKMAKLIQAHQSAPDVGVVGSGFKTSLWESVFLNSFFSHAHELEDLRFIEGPSWDITVVPLLLSLAETKGLSGRTLTEALVVGLEAHARTCMFSPHHLGITLFPGAVGPALAGARALGLDEKQTASAIGLALSTSPLSFVNFGTDAHYLESALQAFQGIVAAEAAQQGMTGNPDLAQYLSSVVGEDKVDPPKMTEGLGQRWMIREFSIKKYPCCFILHRHIDCVVELFETHGLSYEDVDVIEDHITPYDEFCDRPLPKTIGDLQFSFQHVLAAAMLGRDVRLEDMTIEAIDAPRFQEARGRVKLIQSPQLDQQTGVAPAQVTIRTKNGAEFSATRTYPVGSHDSPLTTDEIVALYYKFTQGVLKDHHIQETSQAILSLELLPDVRHLMDTLVFGTKG